PIGDLYKTQVFELARHLDIPAAIVAKKPSADLWPGQSDEAEIGIAYADLDVILHLMIDRRWDEGEIVERGYALPLIRRIRKMIAASQFKRTMPPVTKLSVRTVGIDFRYLRDWNK
ncbi:MAG TPA: NAD(+) synthase, partial [Candidatus Binatia bacterium]|nr:NAD(+) synthase [Candidatus Binatia bacterium]